MMSHRPYLQDGEAQEPTITVALGKYIQRLQKSLNRNLESLSRAVTPDSVHGTHTAARRLRAVLNAFKRELNPAALHRYAAASQKLSHGLDAHALQDCLGDLHDLSCVRRTIENQWRYRGAASELSANFKARHQELLDRFRKHRNRLQHLWSTAKYTDLEAYLATNE